MENKKYNVLVLMATYNGEKYLRCQIDSILNQKDVKVFLYIADDRSTDSTISILEEYKSKYNNIEYYVNEKNKKFTYNFIDLIFNAKKLNMDFDYYALSDQDDYWEENKIIEAIKNFDSEEPTLYCSNLKVVDKDLNFIKMYDHNRYIDAVDNNCHTNILTNICTGCTIVFNDNLYKTILEYYPKDIYLHDYWLFLIAAYTGKLVYDNNSYIQYRQHGDNMIGALKEKKSFFGKLHSIMFEEHWPNSHLCSELLKGYSDKIDKDKIKPVIYMANYKKKFTYKYRIAFSRKYKLKFKSRIGLYLRLLHHNF